MAVSGSRACRMKSSSSCELSCTFSRSSCSTMASCLLIVAFMIRSSSAAAVGAPTASSAPRPAPFLPCSRSLRSCSSSRLRRRFSSSSCCFARSSSLTSFICCFQSEARWCAARFSSRIFCFSEFSSSRSLTDSSSRERASTCFRSRLRRVIMSSSLALELRKASRLVFSRSALSLALDCSASAARLSLAFVLAHSLSRSRLRPSIVAVSSLCFSRLARTMSAEGSAGPGFAAACALSRSTSCSSLPRS
mmetsp:Transcript_59713/g.175191  ORF Transcript_59713/g.175191 Transcript_59713/m.175191 type:complete len:249 (-) Transcript_59713:122-868(-)